MHTLVAADHPIERIKVKKDEAIRIFTEANMTDKLAVLRSANRKYLTLYRCLGYYDYLYGCLLYTSRCV